ncbi:MAG: FimB/Mfa2 family fimbrial subunit [Rikenellaceae bacterium]|nr:FimB/Mfa2 family fimbrial subunit [Rikenellaceae bacterium]
MRRFKLWILPAVLFALTGCFKEDYSFCPPEEKPYNVSIAYSLPDGNGGCTFLRDISTVTTAVYDASGALVQTLVTTEADHALFKGVRTTLAPGTYRIISWGNSGTNTQLSNIDACYTDGNSYVSYRTVNAGRVGNGDALYYGPNTVRTRAGNEDGEFVITVGDNGYEGTINFRPAHRVIEVYVKGYDENGSATPGIELTGLPQGLTFKGMGRLQGSDLVTAQLPSQMVTVNEGGISGQYALARFHVFYLRAGDYDIGVHVLDPVSGAEVFAAKLNEYIDAASDDPDSAVTIRLVIEFGSGTVEVSVPDWNSDDVKWDLFD